jgi:hypothetical protein
MTWQLLSPRAVVAQHVTAPGIPQLDLLNGATTFFRQVLRIVPLAKACFATARTHWTYAKCVADPMQSQVSSAAVWVAATLAASSGWLRHFGAFASAGRDATENSIDAKKATASFTISKVLPKASAFDEIFPGVVSTLRRCNRYRLSTARAVRDQKGQRGCRWSWAGEKLWK